ncbi:LacI family transcriptional regulator [Cryobacterium sp. Hb1]|nr:LacI family transcriptional regulator [Cryobacterium sp. Hb1]
MHQSTITDVAHAANVSTATVSRALSGTGRVSEKTRRKVLKVASELGYMGNSIARALRSKHSGIVGMIVPSISNPFFTALVESVEHELQLVGKTLFLCDSQGDVALEARRLRSLQESHVDGILISPCHGIESVTALNNIPKSIPVVQLDQFVVGTATDWVGIDDEKAMELVLSHAAQQGATSAVFVSSASTNSSTQARLAGFLKHSETHGISVEPDDIMLGRFSVEWGEKVGARLLAHPKMPDVIVCGADIIAFGIIRAFTAAEVSIPGRVMLTGFDDVAFASIITPSLTTVRQPTRLLAAEAVRLMSQPPTEGVKAHAKVAFAPQLIIRESTTRPAGGDATRTQEFTS